MEADGSLEGARIENTEQTLPHRGVTETLSFASKWVYSLDSQNNGVAGESTPGESEHGEVKGNIGGDEPLIGEETAGEDYSKLYKLSRIGAKWYSCCFLQSLKLPADFIKILINIPKASL